tara:strand:- start:67 stop:882 length:816 start_codon:yes stop_codon:yes gene_type:complete
MKKAQILIALITISSLTIFNSCSSDTDTAPKETVSEEAPKKDLATENTNETISTTIDKSLIIGWNNNRKDKDSINSILINSGNKFSFVKDRVSKTIHAYMGYNDESKRLSLTFVDSAADTIGNKVCIAKAIASEGMENLPDFKHIDKDNPDYISMDTAKTRITNWTTADIREKWMTARFNKKEKEKEASNVIFQAFVINAIDFDAGVQHDCYIALKDTNIDKGANNADLIILNTKTNKIVNASLEDLTTPIPPFGNLPTNQFGLLETIKNN